MAHAFKLITFDVTGTLIVFRQPVAVKYVESAKKFGIIVKTEDILQNFKTQWKVLSKTHPNFGKDTGLGWENWWSNIVVNTFKSAAPFHHDEKLKELAAFLIEEYKTTRCWALADGALDLLSSLKRSNTPLGIISNYDERLETTLESLKIHSYFNFIITSYSAGVMKPDKKIFDFARAQMEGDICSDKCLHVGNSVAFDYCGAKNAGWRSIYVGNANEDGLTLVDKRDIMENLRKLKAHLEIK